MAEWMWGVVIVGGPIVLGLLMWLGQRQSRAFRRNREAVREQQEGVRRGYGNDPRDRP